MTDPTTPVTTDNRCYRHPNRETFVKCQRCGRPICGECQTLAPVGVHCPECVREARGSVAAGVRPVGRRFATAVRPGSGRPIVTFTIIGINVIVFILELLTGNSILGNGTGTVANALAYSPGEILVAPWTVVTNAFVHASILHIGLNMYSLFVLGVPLERYFGRGRFTAIYLIGILGSTAGVEYLSKYGVIGASGAIFALLGVLILFSRRLGFNPTFLIIIGVVNLGYGFVATGISWQDHLGGLVAGILLGLLLLSTRTQRRAGIQVAGLVALPVIFALAIFFHAAALRG
jgi:membrane associated rhomboid family serine protease